jgi:hypothetical protein
MAESNLKQFLIDLASDIERRRRYGSAAEEMMEEARLTEEEKDALRSGDNDKIRRLLGPPHGLIHIHIHIHVSFIDVDID